ncbi:MAG: hypothetical protein HYR84_12895 [Planctomycetes bacterium]|nr:hypothetical protein [Planctomycetota bacterium]
MTRMHWPAVAIAALSLIFLFAATAVSDDDTEGKGKGKSAQKAPKTEAKAGKAFGTLQLPPGLARKPANHPGRMNWIKAHTGAKATPAPKKGPAPMTEKKKKGDDRSSDLERRLDRLLTEVEQLRAELRKKKY